MKRSAILIILTIICIFFTASLYAEITNSNLFFKLDSISDSDKYESVKFNHSKHISISGNCGICHHQHGNNSTLPCKDCHSVSSSTFQNSVVNGFMSCKNCHSTFNRDMPGMPGLKAAYHRTCFQCHRGMANVGIDPKGCTQMCHAKKEQKVSMKTRK